MSGMPSVATVSDRGRVEVLDLLRLIAVLAVMMYHYCFRGAAADGFTTTSLVEFVPIAKYGYLGVQMFFVISGFVIAYSAEGRNAVTFAIARAGRIYPGFVFCMTVTFIVTLALGAPRFATSVPHWLANFIVVAPALKQPFMDGAYWSIVYEVTFYGWVALLISLGLFRRHIDFVVVIWLALSIGNEAMLHSDPLRRLLVTDQSGFFAAGLMLYEIYCGRRDLTAMVLMALAVVCALDQGVHSLDWMRAHFDVRFDEWVVLAVCLASIGLVASALCVRRVPLRPGLVVAIGGLTYPLYLLHQHIGYMIFNRIGDLVPAQALIAGTTAGMLVLALAVWRVVERPGQRGFKSLLTRLAARLQQMIGARLGGRLPGVRAGS
jgi:peptidoglycan/LPS O-acetylase OafA/YrhL